MTLLRKSITLLTLLAVFLPAACFAEAKVPLLGVEDVAGENFTYHIDFLFFKRLGEGTLTLETTETPDIYRAELVGRTLGIASWLTGNRTQAYTSTMQLLPDGSFRSIEHVSNVKKKKRGKWRHYSKVCQFDFVNGKVSQKKIKQGELVSSEEHDIPEGPAPVDMLTAFYNLRLGVYGKLSRGNKIFIPTYSTKGFTEIEVTVLTLEEQKKKRAFPEDGLLVKAVIDPEIFETDTGNLYVWFDDKGVPGKGVIEDMIGLGDIKGYLEKEQP